MCLYKGDHFSSFLLFHTFSRQKFLWTGWKETFRERKSHNKRLFFFHVRVGIDKFPNLITHDYNNKLSPCEEKISKIDESKREMRALLNFLLTWQYLWTSVFYYVFSNQCFPKEGRVGRIVLKILLIKIKNKDRKTNILVLYVQFLIFSFNGHTWRVSS